MEGLTHAGLCGSGQSGYLEGKHLTFWVNRQLMGLSIAHVVQIVGNQPITPFPDPPPGCKGMIHLRGSMIPLIDLKLRFMWSETEFTERTSIIVCSVNGKDFGLIVDGVEEVTNIPGGLISPPPRIGADGANRCLAGVARLKQGNVETIVLLIEAAKILDDDEFVMLSNKAE